MSSFRHIPIRRAVPAALVAGMLLSILPAATMASDPVPQGIQAAEWKVLAHMNDLRAHHGLKPLRMAGRVRLVARDRSQSMKRLNYFGHVSPSGSSAGTMLRHRGVQHRLWGENIGWTVHMDLDWGTKWMVDWWKQSPPHRKAMLSRDYNFAGIGIARKGPKLLYTIVFVNRTKHAAFKKASHRKGSGGDRKAAVSGTIRTPKARVDKKRTTKSRRDVTLRWWGDERSRSDRTVRLRGFTIEHRPPGGVWKTVLRRTTRQHVSFDLNPGMHGFRVRAQDRSGNSSDWQGPLRLRIG